MLRNNINKEKMNAIEFAKTHNIKIMGNKIKVFYENGCLKKDGIFFGEPCYDNLTDRKYNFTALHDMTLEDSYNKFDQCGYKGNCITFDTQEVWQLDVDFRKEVEPHPELVALVNDLKTKTPFSLSSTKNTPHLFFKPSPECKEYAKKYEINRFVVKEEYKREAKIEGFKKPVRSDMEIMSGQGTWIPKDKAFKNVKDFNKTGVDTIYNADMAIITLGVQELGKYFDFVSREGQKPIKKNKKTIKKKSKASGGLVPVEQYTEDQKYFTELGDLIPLKQIADFDTWKRIVWSLRSFDSNNALYPVAKRLSQKTDNYCEDKFNDIWNSPQDLITIGTFKHFCKEADKEAYKSIEVKYFKRLGACFSTQLEMAEYFLKTDKGRLDLVYCNDNIFHYNKKTGIWEEDHKQTLGRLHAKVIPSIIRYCNGQIPLVEQKIKDLKKEKKTIDDMENSEITDEIKEKYEKVIEELEYYDGKGMSSGVLGDFKKVKKEIQNVALSNNVATMIKRILSIEQEEIEFDTQAFYFTFSKDPKTGEQPTIDLRTGDFITPAKLDYQAMNCGYLYRESTEEERNWVENNLFNKIFTNVELRNYYKKVLATGLIGATPQKFIIANGHGGNGKGVIHSLMRATCGLYGLKGNADIFLNEKQRGANPEIANLHKIRFATFDEPASGKAINTSLLKEMSGGTEIMARKLYSNETTCKIFATLVLETNEMLKLSGSKLGDAERRRILDILFSSKFTDNKEILSSNTPGIFPADPIFLEHSWKDTYKYALFDLLLKEITGTDNIFRELTPPKQVEDRTNNYIESSKELLNTIKDLVELLERTPETKKDNYISIRELTERIKASDWYGLLTKQQKKNINSSYIKDYIKGELVLDLHYTEDKVKIGKTCVRSALFWAKWRSETEEEITEL